MHRRRPKCRAATNLSFRRSDPLRPWLDEVRCGYCMTASAFSGGLWIVDNCAQSGGVTTAEGDYQFAVPAAYSYSSVTITTSAYSHGGTTRMFGALRTVIGLSPHVIMSPTAPAVSNLGTFTDGIVNASYQVIVGVGVDNSLRSPSELDIGWVAITLHYTVKLSPGRDTTWRRPRLVADPSVHSRPGQCA